MNKVKYYILSMLSFLPLFVQAQASGGQIKRKPTPTIRSSQNKQNNDGNLYAKTGDLNGYDYVDLGLSVKWATYNVGANSPEQYGKYYAWGELNSKSNYTKQNCETYGIKMNDISGNPQYDVARYIYGATWRIPTKNEFNELIEQCKWIKTKYKNVTGYKVTGPNGKSIFLPFGGTMLDDRIDESTNYNQGNYWTSTPYTRDSPNSAPDDNDLSWFVFIEAKGPTLFYGNYMYRRGLGLNIRPVCN